MSVDQSTIILPQNNAARKSLKKTKGWTSSYMEEPEDTLVRDGINKQMYLLLLSGVHVLYLLVWELKVRGGISRCAAATREWRNDKMR